MPSPVLYAHRQRAPLFGFLGAVGCLWILIVGLWVEWHWLMVVPGLILLYLPFAFASLHVEVRPGEVRLRFSRIGPRRCIDLGRVRALHAVRNHWLYGWGIRGYPGGWMWNVWGLDAVELAYEPRGHFRIGTDQPLELARALREAGVGKSE